MVHNRTISDIRTIKQLGSGKFATGNDDSKIYIFSSSSFEILTVLVGHSNSVSSLELLRNGLLMSAGMDDLIGFWDLSTYQLYDFYNPNFLHSNRGIFRAKELSDGSVIVFSKTNPLSKFRLHMNGSFELVYSWQNIIQHWTELCVTDSTIAFIVMENARLINQSNNQIYLDLTIKEKDFSITSMEVIESNNLKN